MSEARDTLPNDPAEIFSDAPKAAEREQRTKTLMDKRPGHIAWATDRANFSGCREIKFTHLGVAGMTPEDMQALRGQLEGPFPTEPQDVANLYFSHRANLLVIDRAVAGDGSLCYLVTTQLDDEDLEELEEAQRRVNFEMREWRAKKEAEKEKQQEMVRENLRLIELGKKAESYGWAKAAKERDEYKDTCADLRRQLTDYEAGDAD